MRAPPVAATLNAGNCVAPVLAEYVSANVVRMDLQMLRLDRIESERYRSTFPFR